MTPESRSMWSPLVGPLVAVGLAVLLVTSAPLSSLSTGSGPARSAISQATLESTRSTASSSGGQPPLDSVVQRIHVGSGPGTGALDLLDNAYVVPLAGCGLCTNGSVAIISTQTQAMLADIPVGDDPQRPVVDPTTGTAYVVTLTGGLYVISVPLLAVIATVQVGWSPWPGAYDPVSGDVYIPANVNSSSNQGEVTIVSTANNSIVTRVQVGGTPFSAIVNPTNGDVYIANADTNNLSVINPLSNKAVSSIATWRSPLPPTYDPANGLLYVALASNSTPSRTVEVINSTSGGLVRNVSVFGAPSPPGYDPATDSLFVACGGGSLAGVGSVSVISGATNTVIAEFPAGGDQLAVPTYDSSDGRMYLPDLNSGNLTVIDGVTNSVVARTPPLSISGFLTFDPVRNVMYSPDYFDHQVLVIGTASGPIGTSLVFSVLIFGSGVGVFLVLMVAVLRRQKGEREWIPNEAGVGE